jgi:Sec-independent protein translocase protein TatA
MKSLCRIILITAAMVVLLMPAALPVMAEEKPGSMEALRDAIKADKKAFIEQYMELTQAEAKEFWPYYNSYQFDLQKINDRLIKLIDDYAKSYKNLSDQDAVTMVNEYLAIERDQLKQKELYFRTLNKTLRAKKVARYLQLENKINAMVRFELAANIPLVK